MKKRYLRQKLQEKLQEKKGSSDEDGGVEGGRGENLHKRKSAFNEQGSADEDDARGVQRLLDSINASLVAEHPRKALLKQDAYKVRAPQEQTIKDYEDD